MYDKNLPLYLLEGKEDGDHKQGLALQCVEEYLLEDRIVAESSWRTSP